MAGLTMKQSEASSPASRTTRLDTAFAEIGSSSGRSIWKSSATSSGFTARPSEHGVSGEWTEEMLNLLGCTLASRMYMNPRLWGGLHLRSTSATLQQRRQDELLSFRVKA